MKLLIVTQSVDVEDPVLGFFHNWILEISKHAASVVVICLRKGVYDLPEHVRVYSLGKEEGKGRFTYIVRFFTYIFSLRNSYDSVFVHMNQEYVLLGGLFWKLLGKKILFWRNHVYGNMLTRAACFMADKILYTSPQSFTSRYTKSIMMPVGIDDTGTGDSIGKREKNSFLVVSRISPIKRIDFIIENFVEARRRDSMPEATLSIYGEALPEHASYEESLHQKYASETSVRFYGKVLHGDTPSLYAAHDFFINMTGKGSYDKTILEAMRGGSLVLTNNPAVHTIVPQNLFVETDEQLKHVIKNSYDMSDKDRDVARHKLEAYVRGTHTLERLGSRLAEEIQSAHI